jgi:hypothetical protein
VQTNARCHRNYIPVQQHEGRDWIIHESKSAALDAYFTQQLGRTTTWRNTLNWEALHLHRHELGDLDREISEEAIHATVMQTAPEKTTKPDGFIGAFYKLCWETVKGDIIGVIKEFFALRALEPTQLGQCDSN